jgi:phage terminase large subunit GpA-like protein
MLSEIVLDFLKKKDDLSQLQTFINTSLAEVWKLKGQQPMWEAIYARREDYEPGIVPLGGLILVAAVDVQADRLEFEVVAYGRGKESWSVYGESLPGDPADMSASGPWKRLDELLGMEWEYAAGGRTPIWAVAIDTGSKPQPVYQFAMRYPRPVWSDAAGTRIATYRTVVPVKGNDDALKLISAVSGTDAAQKRSGLRIWSVGTHWAKQELYDLLNLVPLEGGAFPPAYCHFPLAYDRAYFQGLCSESRVVRSSGKVEWIKESGLRNEALDLRVYARAAAELCGVSRYGEKEWTFLEEVVKKQPEAQAPPQPQAREWRTPWIRRHKEDY